MRFVKEYAKWLKAVNRNNELIGENIKALAERRIDRFIFAYERGDITTNECIGLLHDRIYDEL